MEILKNNIKNNFNKLKEKIEEKNVLIDSKKGLEKNMKDLANLEKFDKRNVFLEMVDSLCGDMFSQNLISKRFSWYTGYDYKSLELYPDYDGELSVDFYGRVHP